MSERDVNSWDKIHCPYCAHLNKRSPEDMPWNDGQEIELDCAKCGKEFVLEAYVTTNWTAKEIEE